MASGPKWNPRRGTWYVQYWKDGKWHRKTVTPPPLKWKPGMILPEPKKVPPEAIAERHRLDKVEAESRRREATGAPSSLAKFLGEHVETYTHEPSRKGVATTVTQFLEWCAVRNIRNVDQVVPSVCDDFLKEFARGAVASRKDESKGRGIRTVRRKRSQLSKAWTRLKKLHGLSNPWEPVEAHGRPPKGDRGSWSKEQFVDLLAVSYPWLQGLLTLGVNTGLRINALIRLEWRDWIKPQDGERGFGRIKVRPELDKIKRGYEVPVSAALHDFLAQQFGKGDPTFILTARGGKPIYSQNVTYRAIIDACRRAGLPKPGSPNHYLRRTFGRWAHFGYLVGKPVPLYIVSRWMGHTNTRTTLEYLDIKEEDSTAFMVPDGD